MIEFPLGYHTRYKGAWRLCRSFSKTVPDEIDTVINMGTKNGDFDLQWFGTEKSHQEAVGGKKILKVLIETMLFNEGGKNGKCAVS